LTPSASDLSRTSRDDWHPAVRSWQPYRRRALVIPEGIPDALSRFDRYANARHRWHCSSQPCRKSGNAIPDTQSLGGRASTFVLTIFVETSRCHLRQHHFLTAAASKEQAMFRNPHSLSKQLVVAAALALGASSVALADDGSMNPSTRDVTNGENRGNPMNKTAQSPSPQAPASVSTQQKKVEQDMESKAFPLNGRPILTSRGYRSPTYFQQYPGE
jgi:hypothetical protein